MKKLTIATMFLLVICLPAYAGSAIAVGAATGAAIGIAMSNQAQASKNADIALKIEMCKANKNINEVKKCLEKVAADKKTKDDREDTIMLWIIGILIALIIIFAIAIVVMDI